MASSNDKQRTAKPKPPTPWTVRSPYRTIIRDDDNKAVSDQPTDPKRSSNPPSGLKSIRATRPTPPFLPNFTRTAPESETDSNDEPARLYNNRNPTYSFPCDELEHSRQDNQHTAYCILFRGLYPCPEAVRDALRNDGTTKSILDLGSGTGTWAIEMGKEFPNATVLGVDLVPGPINSLDIPPNVRFEIDDVNDGLDHFYELFDLIHVRSICQGIRNYRKMMEEVSKCLKPGGLAIFIDVDLEILHRDMVTVLPMALLDHEIRAGVENGAGKELEASWLQRVAYEIKSAAQLGGSDMSGADTAIDEGLWRMSMFDSTTCGASSVFSPIGSWLKTTDETSTVHLQHVGSLMRLSILSVLRASRSLFLRAGISQSTIDQWVSSATYELKAEKFESFSRLRVAWGRRKQDPESVASSSTRIPLNPPVHDSVPSTNHYDRIHQNCQPVAVYATQAEALMAKEARIMTRPVQPIPYVYQLAHGKALT